MSFWGRLLGRAEQPAAVEAPAPAPEPPAPEPVTAESPAVPREPEPLAVPEVAPEPRRADRDTAKGSDPVAADPVAAEAGPPTDEADLEVRLSALLDSLGSAHRRPFARNG